MAGSATCGAHVQRFAAELVGNLYLTAAIVCVSARPEIGAIGGAFAVGSTLFALIYALGHVSSAHFNPAVTAVQLVRRDITAADAVAYVVAQLLGSLFGALAGVAIAASDIAAPSPADATAEALRRAFVAEALFTSFLVHVILHVAASKQKNNAFFGSAITASVVAGALCVGPVSGAAFNPAVASGLVAARCASSATTGGGCAAAARMLWLYWVAPLVGAGAGALLFAALTVGDALPTADPEATRPSCGKKAGARRQVGSGDRGGTELDAGGSKHRSGDDTDDDIVDDETVCLRMSAGPSDVPPAAPGNTSATCLRARTCRTGPVPSRAADTNLAD